MQPSSRTRRRFVAVAMITAATAFCVLAVSPAQAQQVVRYTYRTAIGPDAPASSGEAEAVLRLPAGPANGAAVVILHHGGGWNMGTTAQYGEYFSQRGFVTLEPRMFFNREQRKTTLTHTAQMMGALQYLAQMPQVRKDAISAVGLSYGAWLAIFAATEWAYKAHEAGDLRFKRLAPLYPVCWLLDNGLRDAHGHWPIFRGLPAGFMQRWEGIEMKIFVGDQDDYDDRDPKACPDFVAAIPDERQRRASSVQVYAGATHGWDHGRTYRFPEPVACKGRGCVNTNRSDPAVTARAKEDLLEFLGRP